MPLPSQISLTGFVNFLPTTALCFYILTILDSTFPKTVCDLTYSDPDIWKLHFYPLLPTTCEKDQKGWLAVPEAEMTGL